MNTRTAAWVASGTLFWLTGCSGASETATQTVTETVTSTVTATSNPSEVTVTVEPAPTSATSEPTASESSPSQTADSDLAGEDLGNGIVLVDQGLGFGRAGDFAQWGATVVNTGSTRQGWVVYAELFDESGTLLDDDQVDITTMRDGQTFHVGGAFLDGALNAEYVEITVEWADDLSELDKPVGEVDITGELLVEGGTAARVRLIIENNTTSTLTDGAEVCYILRNPSQENVGGDFQYLSTSVAQGDTTQALIDGARVAAEPSWTVEVSLAYDEFNFER